MAEKKEGAQLGARMDPDLKRWIQETADELKITQGELVREMQRAYVETEVTQKYPEWAAQIKDVHFWARSLVAAYEAQVEHGAQADSHAREEVQKVLERKDDLIAQQLQDIKDLKEQNRILNEATRKSEDLQRDLDAARARVGEVESDAKQRMDDLRTTNDSLMRDKVRLEAEIQRCLDQIAGMTTAVASYEAMKAERDNALAKIEEERRAGQEAQKQAVEATKAAMQDQIKAINDRLHEAVVAQAATQAEANSLREFRSANDRLHEVVGEQKARIAMLEEQVAAMDRKANECEAKAAEWQEKSQEQGDQIRTLQAQIQVLKTGRNAGADGQTAIEGV